MLAFQRPNNSGVLLRSNNKLRKFFKEECPPLKPCRVPLKTMQSFKSSSVSLLASVLNCGAQHCLACGWLVGNSEQFVELVGAPKLKKRKNLVFFFLSSSFRWALTRADVYRLKPNNFITLIYH